MFLQGRLEYGGRLEAVLFVDLTSFTPSRRLTRLRTPSTGLNKVRLIKQFLSFPHFSYLEELIYNECLFTRFF